MKTTKKNTPKKAPSRAVQRPQQRIAELELLVMQARDSLEAKGAELVQLRARCQALENCLLELCNRVAGAVGKQLPQGDLNMQALPTAVEKEVLEVYRQKQALAPLAPLLPLAANYLQVEEARKQTSELTLPEALQLPLLLLPTSLCEGAEVDRLTQLTQAAAVLVREAAWWAAMMKEAQEAVDRKQAAQNVIQMEPPQTAN